MKTLEVLYLDSRPVEQCQPKHKQNHLKKLRNKQTKQNYNHCKKFEAFTPRAKFDLFKYIYFKNMFKTKFFLEIAALLYLQGLKNSLALEDRLTQKRTKNF